MGTRDYGVHPRANSRKRNTIASKLGKPRVEAGYLTTGCSGHVCLVVVMGAEVEFGMVRKANLLLGAIKTRGKK